MAKKSKQKIPAPKKEQALETVSRFNEEHGTAYSLRFRGRYAYLAREDRGMPDLTRIGRLEYLADKDRWKFVVYRYSKERYDPRESLFPGAGHLDGSIEGALRAGLEIYPDRSSIPNKFNGCNCLLLLILLPFRLLGLGLRKLFGKGGIF